MRLAEAPCILFEEIKRFASTNRKFLASTPALTRQSLYLSVHLAAPCLLPACSLPAPRLLLACSTSACLPAACLLACLPAPADLPAKLLAEFQKKGRP